MESLLINDPIIHTEHLIIDGNSNDLVLSFQELQNKYNFHYIKENDTGIYNAMNKGIINSTGKRLLFLNSGDTLINGPLFNKYLTLYPGEDLVYSNVIKVLKNGIEVKNTFPQELTLDYMISYGLPHQATLINRSLFDKVGLYNEDYKIISDWVFFMEALFFYNASYKYVNEDVVYFDGSGISNQSKYLKVIIREQMHYISKRFPSKLSLYKSSSPYVNKYFRRIPRWKRFIIKQLFLYFNFI